MIRKNNIIYNNIKMYRREIHFAHKNKINLNIYLSTDIVDRFYFGI